MKTFRSDREGIKIPSRISITIGPGISFPHPPSPPPAAATARPAWWCASRLITHLHPSIGAASHDHLHHGPPAPYHPSCQPPAPSHPRRGRPDKVSGAPRDPAFCCCSSLLPFSSSTSPSCCSLRPSRCSSSSVSPLTTLLGLG